MQHQDQGHEQPTASSQPTELNWFCLDGAREVLTAARVEGLCAPLAQAAADGDVGRFQALRLSGKSFSVEAAEAMARLMSPLRGLRVVDLSDTIAGQNEDDAQKVLEVLCEPLKLQQLEELNLSDNALGPRGVRVCREALASQRSLKRLYFNNNGLSGASVAMIAEIVCEHMDVGKLTTFHIHNNMMHDEGALALAPMLEKASNLADLRISTTRVSQEGGLAIAKAISTATGIEALDLCDNSLGEEAGMLLATMLPKQKRMRVLKLGDTGIGEGAVSAVLAALQDDAFQPDGLQELDLQCSDITTEMVPDLARALARMRSLRKLNLESNELRTSGIKALAPVLASFSALEDFNIAYNFVTTTGIVALAGALKPSAQHIKHVNVNGNQIKPGGVQALREALDDSVDPFSDNDDEYSESDVGDAEIDDLADLLASQARVE